MGIDKVATTGQLAGAIRRLARAPEAPVKYPYLVVSDKIEDITKADLITIQDFSRVKQKLKKKTRTGSALEILIAHARMTNGEDTADWLVQVEDAYKFCKLASRQLVISSGATAPFEMISGRSFDALLEECKISPAKYWTELEEWLDSRLRRRVKI